MSETILSQPIPNYQNRKGAIDLLRGVVMIIMALDHVRDYFHAGAFLYDPLDLEKASTALFFTRWITHFCAPVFMFLAGTSAFLVGLRKSKKELSLFLLKRGVWLILLELTLINFAWNFDTSFTNIYFIVIWALGISMVVLAGVIYLPYPVILITGIALVAGHNLLDNIHVPGNNLKSFAWSLLHDLNFFSWGGKNILVGYPCLPWIGVMILGYSLGKIYSPAFSTTQRKKWLLFAGVSAILLFIVIRWINSYGDPAPWSHQPTMLKTFLSFIKTTKYPPSLLYLLMTLGPALVFLALTENTTSLLSKVVSLYGRVPMFYYVLHIFLIHTLTMIAAELFTSYSWKDWVLKQPLWFAEYLEGYGFSLGIVYLVWLGIVIGLYPLCRWYDGYKSRHKEKWWLSYL